MVWMPATVVRPCSFKAAPEFRWQDERRLGREGSLTDPITEYDERVQAAMRARAHPESDIPKSPHVNTRSSPQHPGTVGNGTIDNWECLPNDQYDTYRAARQMREAGLTDAQVQANMASIVRLLRHVDALMAINAQTLRADFAGKSDMQRRMYEMELKLTSAQHELRNELKVLEQTDFRHLRQEVEVVSDKMERDYQEINNQMMLLEQRRDSSRLLLEQQVAKDVETMNYKLQEMENRLIKYAIGFAASFSAAGLALARIVQAV